MSPAVPRVLITGGAGFVGRWLALEEIRAGSDVTLAGLGERPTDLRPPLADAGWATMDVRSPDGVRAVVSEVLPSIVYHLAGISFPPEAEDSAATTYEVNVVGAVNLLEAIRLTGDRGPGPRIVVVGSGTQYGRHDASAMPLPEDAEQRPISVYAASKAAQEVAAFQMFRSHGLAVICTRSFNHSGVGHGGHFLLPSLVRRAVELARAGGGGALSIGNDTLRDFMHVSDVAAAYFALARSGVPGEAYNVCSGSGVRVSELARAVLLRLGLEADISPAPILARSAEVADLVGSPAKLIEATGWSPRLTYLDIIDDLINAAT